MIVMKIVYTTNDLDHNNKAVDILRRRLLFSSQLLKKVRLHGELLVNGEKHRMIDAVPSSSQMEITYHAEDELPAGSILKEQENILIPYQDDWLLVADKPASLLTHPSYLGETHALTTILTSQTLHPVSRLDRDTSGLIILGKNGFSHDQLSRQEIRKRYIGFVHGILPESEGIIDAAIARSPDSIITREVNMEGQEARTRYVCFATLIYEDGTIYQLVGFELETGRTHQIRVHCKWKGHPLIGDSLYLDDQLAHVDQILGRQALHAISLEFKHPLTQEAISIQSKLRADMTAFISKSTIVDGTIPADLMSQLN